MKIPNCKHKNRNIKGNGLCESCYQMKYRKEHPERYKKWLENGKPKRIIWMKEWREKNRERNRFLAWKYKLENVFGINIDDYEEMFKEQSGKCAICEVRLDKLEIDHNHITGKIRGLLCGLCNKGLGLFRDNSGLLERAMNYLIKNV